MVLMARGIWRLDGLDRLDWGLGLGLARWDVGRPGHRLDHWPAGRRTVSVPKAFVNRRGRLLAVILSRYPVPAPHIIHRC